MINETTQIDPSLFDTSKKEIEKNEGSILDIINTGFNSDNVVTIKPSPPPEKKIIET